MASTSSNLPHTVKSRSGFTIQKAILVLRQGKSNRLWREAAAHLIEYAGKDTQLLLEAQKDLLLAAQPEPVLWPKYILWAVMGLAGLALIGLSLWQILSFTKSAC
jgi:hypothetical protein